MADFNQGATRGFDYVDGQWVDGFLQPNFKKALERLKTAYQAKVFDPYSFKSDYTISLRFTSGRVGMAVLPASQYARSLEEGYKLNNMPNAKVIALLCIKGSVYRKRGGPVLAIPKITKDPEFVFKKVIETMYDGDQGQLLFTHGVEGVHYKVENGEFKKLIFRGYPSDKLFTFTMIPPEAVLNKWKDPFPLDGRIENAFRVVDQNFRYIFNPPGSGYGSKHDALIDKIDRLKSEVVFKVMNGEYSVDKGLKIYKEKAVELGVEQLLEEFNNYE